VLTRFQLRTKSLGRGGRLPGSIDLSTQGPPSASGVIQELSGGHVRDGDLDEAAGGADAIVSNMGRYLYRRGIAWVTRRFRCDPFTQNDAGGNSTIVENASATTFSVLIWPSAADAFPTKLAITGSCGAVRKSADSRQWRRGGIGRCCFDRNHDLQFNWICSFNASKKAGGPHAI
jgi:hypothetical protein